MTRFELSVREMIESEANEFVFCKDLPKREKSRLRKFWDHFQELRAIGLEHGMLVPVKFAADVAGVSYQRIQELCALETLKRVEVNGHPFITEKSLVAWAQGERKAGRPLKTPQGNVEMIKVAREFANEHVRGKKKSAK